MNKTADFQPSLFPELTHDACAYTGIVNVASVPQRSPFRYPGGKTWLVPTARKWFSQCSPKSELLEPFAGGGIIGLTAAAEHYFERVTMVELDDDVSAVWQTVFSDDFSWLIQQIRDFTMTVDAIHDVVLHAGDGVKERAFATIVRNRTNHGGILAKGSGRIKTGEAGKGLCSRWYPQTLVRRIAEANKLRGIIRFVHGDAFDVLERRKDDASANFFIDPPYTVAGKRLYNLFDVDHRRIFALASELKGHFLLTYNDNDEVRGLATEFALPFRTVPMQTTHLIKKQELLISDNFEWLTEKLQDVHYA